MSTESTPHAAARPSAPADTARREAVYEQVVDGFGTVRVLPVRPAEDIDVIHAWVAQDRARFWGMAEAGHQRVLEIYEHLDSLTTHHAYLVHRDDEPVALLQTYEPGEDRVGEVYDVEPGDIGVHLLIGPAAGAARSGFTAALLPALIAYLLADPERRRIVVDPDARNEKAIARMSRTGFVMGPEVVLPEVVLPEVRIPEKRARLGFLHRDDVPVPA
ncbi:GNAT family N-acetyltransferase [Streptomyces sp. XD-27]|uniref:GNAT family N-acetyltransferase n=1 Tax=Streptomyces sp. XD-27 TaxID=3062779 RepID=UPI0026F43A48|nr:GNAT family N-acetyltransferase [Streptomyces sp. XD-27]WKX69103.1 GNAT family N-acetyltransferase [Streptomyces sp. XD-27]